MKIKELIELLAIHSPDFVQNHELYVCGFGCYGIIDYFEQEIEPEVCNLLVDTWHIELASLDDSAPDLWLAVFPVESGDEYENAQDCRSAAGYLRSGDVFIESEIKIMKSMGEFKA